jgi:hypothetical protein
VTFGDYRELANDVKAVKAGRVPAELLAFILSELTEEELQRAILIKQQQNLVAAAVEAL